VRKEFVSNDEDSFWAFCIEFLDGQMAPRKSGSSPKVDYKEVLSPEDFAVFSKLRDLRKSLAESEGVPVYAIFTNEQLADVAKARPPSKAALGKINGIGEGRLESVVGHRLRPFKTRNHGGGSSRGLKPRSLPATRPARRK